MPAILCAILTNLTSAAASLFWIVLLLAGGANSTPARITQIKWMLVGTVVLQGAAILLSVWAVVAERGWLATAIGIVPAVCIIITVIVLVRIEW
ncbi:hypothetical protein [Synechococcus sp. Cruz CV-v-12]|uniref:hypothetical protein n=1 Tax=Synechococcus sp. Cruz CV-v-12 TaxID=2823728 RepID=UPI0020CC1EAB|nr:hypothetical protein [Synechococcus sp. Cruz CV-v-12]MCP9874703.1 hypothetical protein [Synechococcus sp. Cruz CV-v-12]